MLRLAIVGALFAAVIALPGLGKMMSRDRLARRLAGLMATALVFVAAHYVQQTTNDPDWALVSVRVQMTAGSLWIPICLLLLAEATDQPAPRPLLIATTALAALPWAGSLLLASETVIRSRTDAQVISGQAGPLFPVFALYGIGMLGYVGLRLWRAEPPVVPTARRIAAVALAVLIGTLINDILLLLGVLDTVTVSDIGIAVGALLLVASLQASATSKAAALEHVSSEAVEDLRAAQNELQIALNNTLNIITTLPDAILLHREGQLEFLNPAGQSWLGLDKAPVGIAVADFLAPRPDEAPRSPLLDLDPPSTSFEERFISREGKTLVGEVRALALMHDGLPMQMAIIRDLTNRREMEQKLLTADRLSSLGTLAAGVGHEINNPLTYISTNLALAREGTEEPEVKEMLDDAYEGVQRVARIVEGLSTFARRRRSADTEIDIHRAIDTAVKLVGHQLRHRARVDIDVEEGLPPVAGSEDDIIQVLVNVLINASHAIDEAPRGDHSITVTARLEAGELVIIVDDTGCGISLENQKRLLEPFFTTKPVGKGTGLGLSICHGIVQGLNGQLSIQGRKRGARAEIRLPLTAPQSIPSKAPQPRPTPRRPIITTMRILVVDDDPMVRRSLRRSLSKHDVTLAHTGERGLEACADELYDLILCDVMMPGISGTEFLTQLAESKPHQAERVVLITGGVFTPEERKRVDAMGARVLQKPITPEQLDETLARFASSSPVMIESAE